MYDLAHYKHWEPDRFAGREPWEDRGGHLAADRGALGLELKQLEDTLPAYTVEHIERPTAN
jgi:hypothetical protein